MAWTDDPVLTGLLTKAVHYEELRNRLDSLNNACAAHCPMNNINDNGSENINDFTPHENVYNNGDDINLNTGVLSGQNINDDAPHYISNLNTERDVKLTSENSPDNNNDYDSYRLWKNYAYDHDVNGVQYNYDFNTRYVNYRSGFKYYDGTCMSECVYVYGDHQTGVNSAHYSTDRDNYDASVNDDTIV